jgi:hypothetical protein
VVDLELVVDEDHALGGNHAVELPDEIVVDDAVDRPSP